MQQPEQTIGVWSHSIFAEGYWWRTLLTVGLYALIHKREQHITLTTHRVSYRRGNLVSGNETSLNLQKVTDVNVTQSVLGTLLRYGDITIQAEGDEPEILFKGLGNPLKLRDMIFALQSNAPVLQKKK